MTRRVSLLAATFAAALWVAFTPSFCFGAVIYGASDIEYIAAVDTSAVTSSVLFNTPGIAWYGATDSNIPNSFYATPYGGPLYLIDVVAQTATQVGSYGGPSIRELAYDEASGVLYGTDYVSLFAVNQATGFATTVGPLSGPSMMWAMDYDQSIDRLVGVNQGDQQLYYIDPATGAATALGPTGVDRVIDIWYDADSGGMFGTTNLPNQLVSIDSSTGAATVIGSLDHSLLGLGTQSAVIPEPAALSLLALGGLGLLRRRRRKP